MAFDQHLTKVVVALCDGLETPKSKLVKAAILSGRWIDLVNLSVSPEDYQTADAYFKDAIAVEFLRKLDGLPTGIDLHAAAVSSFYGCEAECLKTNTRLARYLGWFTDGFVGDSTDLRLYDFINKVRARLQYLLGPVPADLSIKLGKGATFYDRGEFVTIPHKFSSRPARTSHAWWTDFSVYKTAWGRSVLSESTCDSGPLIVKGNRFTSVPKDSKKNRGICIEPSANLAAQLSIGGYLKRQLKRSGIDLFTAQQRHRDLAQRASIDGRHATIDLSNASDTVSTNLVKLLLPRMWFDLLNDLRSPFTEIDGRWVKLEKFSSMGNGFTFELETLLFSAIAASCCPNDTGHKLVIEGDVLTYGDDIIVPTEVADDVVAALRLFGFTPNAKKTFLTGRFRESCGGDFFDGQPVRPFYLKEIPDAPHKWISLVNGLRRMGVADSKSGTWRFGLLRPWLNALDAIPSPIRRIRGPRALGDLVIHDSPQTWMVRSCWSHRFVRTWAPQTGRISLKKFSPTVQLASALYGVPSTGPTPRLAIKGYKKRWMPLLEASEF